MISVISNLSEELQIKKTVTLKLGENNKKKWFDRECKQAKIIFKNALNNCRKLNFAPESKIVFLEAKKNY